jgi:hypothetical protein
MIRTFGTGAKTRKVTLDLATGCYAPLLLASSSWDWFSSCSSVSCSRTLVPRRPSRERRLSSIFFRLGLRRHLGRSKAEFPLLSQNRLGLFEPCVQGRDCFRYHGGDPSSILALPPCPWIGWLEVTGPSPSLHLDGLRSQVTNVQAGGCSSQLSPGCLAVRFELDIGR